MVKPVSVKRIQRLSPADLYSGPDDCAPNATVYELAGVEYIYDEVPPFSLKITTGSQEVELLSGGRIDFSGDTITFTVTEGSALVNAEIIPSLDANNLLTIGSDNKLYVGETLTSLALVSGNLEYTDENGAVTTIGIVTADVYVNNGSFDNDAGVLTLQDNSGATVDVLIDLSALRTFVTDNGDGTYSIDNGLSTLVLDTRAGISTDAGNLLSLGSDLKPYINLAAIPMTETDTSIVDGISGHTIGRYVNESSALFDINETITSIAIDEPSQTISFVDETGTVTTLDATKIHGTFTISANLAGNVLTLVDNNPTTSDVTVNLSGLRSSVANIGNGIYTHNNGDGVITVIDVKDGVSSDAGNIILLGSDNRPYLNSTTIKAHETATTLVDNGDDTYTYTNEAGVAQVLSTVTGASSDFGNLLIDGTDGKPILLAGVIAANETTTSVVPLVSGHPIANHTNEDGVAATINETVTSLTYNPLATTLTYVDESGDSTVVNLSSLTTDIYVNGGSFDANSLVLTLTDNSGSTPDIQVDLSSLQGSVTNNGNDTYTYDNGSGSTVLIDTRDGVSSDAGNLLVIGSDNRPILTHASIQLAETTTIVTNNGNGLYTYTNEDGVSFGINTRDGLSVDAGNNLVLGSDGLPYYANPETQLVNNGNSTYTHMNEGGVATVIDVRDGISSDAGNDLLLGSDSKPYFVETPDVVTTLVNNLNSTYTYTNESGAPVTVDIRDGVSSDAGNSLSLGSDQKPYYATVSDIVTTITNNGNNTYTYVNESGVSAVIDVKDGVSSDAGNLLVLGTDSRPHLTVAQIAANETTTNVLNNGNGTYTYTNEDGVASTIDTRDGVSSDAGNLIVLGSDSRPFLPLSAIPPNETTTTISGTVAGHQIALYTNENAVVVPINETVTSLAFAAETLSYTNENGVLNNIDLSAYSQIAVEVPYSNISSGLLATNVQAAIDEINSKVVNTYSRTSIAANVAIANSATYASLSTLTITVPSAGVWWVRYKATFDFVNTTTSTTYTMFTRMNSSTLGVLDGTYDKWEIRIADSGWRFSKSLGGAQRITTTGTSVITVQYFATGWNSMNLLGTASTGSSYVEYERVA